VSLEINHDVAAAGGTQIRKRRLDQPDRAKCVYLHQRQELSLRRPGDRVAATGDAGVADHDVDRSEVVARGLDHGADRAAVIDGCLVRGRLPAGRDDLLDNLFRGIVLAPVVHRDRGTVRREPDRNRPPDSSGGTRDNSHSAVEPRHRATT
jgi:hypothetical protein